MAEPEAQRILVTAQRRSEDSECQDNIKLLMEAGCNLTLN
jgi:hypothetical protein